MGVHRCRAHMALIGAFLIHLTLGEAFIWTSGPDSRGSDHAAGVMRCYRMSDKGSACLFLHFLAGSLHAFGNIAPLIIAYMRLLQPSASIRYHVRFPS